MVQGLIDRNVDDENNTLNQLNFSMANDKFISSSITAIVSEKDKMVKSEKFKEAKILKELQIKFSKVGATIMGIAIDKQKAVRSEDYDLASDLQSRIEALKKDLETDLDKFGLGSDQNDSLNLAKKTLQTNPTPTGRTLSPQNQRVVRLPEASSPRTFKDQNPIFKPPETVKKARPASEIPLETLSPQQMAIYKLPISIFGQDTVSRAVDSNWNHRKQGIQDVLSFISDSELTENTVLACFQLLELLVEDQREPAYKASLELLEKLANHCISGKIDESLVLNETSKLLPTILLKSGDMNNRISNVSIKCIMNMAKALHAENSILPLIIKTDYIKPLEALPWKHIKSRLDLVHELIKLYGIDDSQNGQNSGLKSQDIYDFSFQFLEHTNQQVRDAACNLTAWTIYQIKPAKFPQSGLRPNTIQSIQNRLDFIAGNGSIK